MNKQLIKTPVVFVAILWGIFVVNFVLPLNLNLWMGVHPREVSGLIGVFTYSFAHGNLFHILSNSIPLLLLSPLVGLATKPHHIVSVYAFTGVVSGFITWVFGLGGYVVGASGIVYGLIGFLLAHAYFSPSLKNWAIALLAFFLYGGALLSMFKLIPGVSWIAHFGGLVAGILFAILYRKISKKTDASQAG